MDGKQQSRIFYAQEEYNELDIDYDKERKTLWCRLSPATRPCCTPELLAEVQHLLHGVEQHVKHESGESKLDPLRYLIIASRVPGVFNLGGDLSLFLKLVRSGDRERLFHYAKSTINIAYTSRQLPITTIALVQGDALGGGFEGALINRVIIAERQARMGLPDVLFNFFPITAYSLLARRISPTRAEHMILSGRMYSAEELYDMGVVDILAENGEGEEAVNNYIKKQNRANNTYHAMHKVRQVHDSMSYDELMRIAAIWIDTALQMSERDLRVMERFAQSQEKLVVLKPSAEIKQLA